MVNSKTEKRGERMVTKTLDLLIILISKAHSIKIINFILKRIQQTNVPNDRTQHCAERQGQDNSSTPQTVRTLNSHALAVAETSIVIHGLRSCVACTSYKLNAANANDVQKRHSPVACKVRHFTRDYLTLLLLERQKGHETSWTLANL